MSIFIILPAIFYADHNHLRHLLFAFQGSNLKQFQEVLMSSNRPHSKSADHRKKKPINTFNLQSLSNVAQQQQQQQQQPHHQISQVKQENIQVPSNIKVESDIHAQHPNTVTSQHLRERGLSRGQERQSNNIQCSQEMLKFLKVTQKKITTIHAQNKQMIDTWKGEVARIENNIVQSLDKQEKMVRLHANRNKNTAAATNDNIEEVLTAYQSLCLSQLKAIKQIFRTFCIRSTRSLKQIDTCINEVKFSSAQRKKVQVITINVDEDKEAEEHVQMNQAERNIIEIHQEEIVEPKYDQQEQVGMNRKEKKVQSERYDQNLDNVS